MRVLTINAGSTSLKLERYQFDGSLPPIGLPPEPLERQVVPIADADAVLSAASSAVDVIAHRFVRLPDGAPPVVLLTQATIAAIRGASADAPMHGGPALRAVEALTPLGIGQFAVSDSAFHATMPKAASTYALPQSITARGLQRRGYHGLSHEYVAHRAARLAEREAGDALCVSLHLGGGSSLCALRGGRSVDTTMGFTPLEGVPMATRSGSVDPGLLVHLLRAGMSVDELEAMLNQRSGLLGMSELSGDVRELLGARDHLGARRALEVFVWRIRASLGAMIAVLGGVDIVAFTGGIGEHAATLRAAILHGAAPWGGSVDTAANDAASGDAVISPRGSRVLAVVVTAREGWQLARAVASAHA